MHRFLRPLSGSVTNRSGPGDNGYGGLEPTTTGTTLAQTLKYYFYYKIKNISGFFFINHYYFY